MTCTIYKNIFSLKEPHYIPISEALKRIKNGRSKKAIEEIRNALDKERSNNLKKNLPSVCFSGKFGTDRTDESLQEHSGYIVLDFDDILDVNAEKKKIIENKYTHSAWISPSGNGLKALVRISNGEYHREHYRALQSVYDGLDESGINPSRVCYESYDPEIFINNNSEIFKEIVKEEVEVRIIKTEGSDLFKKILVWLTNKGDAFEKGQRNVFIFKLAAACCRFGISEDECYSYSSLSFNDGSFSHSELKRTIKSAYKSNPFGTAEFTNEELIDKATRKELTSKEINPDKFNLDVKPKDVIFGIDAKEKALNIFENGYEKIQGIGVPILDYHFKMKRGEITLLTGIGNYGKSSFLKWYLVMRIIKHGDKFALFAPEDNPAEEFYHDMVEVYLGCDCTPESQNKPSRERYEHTYDLISKHIFYIYPKELDPTPEYIKEKFLELIFKEKISGCIIDPFNQMSNNYGSSGGRTDKYLETFLSDCSRFAQTNNIFFMIVAHPKMMQKDGTGNYPCPDVFDIADGAMWNNKMDNILVYHRPNHQTEVNSTLCELHTKKIRRQKTVGKKGVVEFDLNYSTRRFSFGGHDYIDSNLIQEPNELFEEGDCPF